MIHCEHCGHFHGEWYKDGSGGIWWQKCSAITHDRVTDGARRCACVGQAREEVLPEAV